MVSLHAIALLWLYKNILFTNELDGFRRSETAFWKINPGFLNPSPSRRRKRHVTFFERRRARPADRQRVRSRRASASGKRLCASARCRARPRPDLQRKARNPRLLGFGCPRARGRADAAADTG